MINTIYSNTLYELVCLAIISLLHITQNTIKLPKSNRVILSIPKSTIIIPYRINILKYNKNLNLSFLNRQNNTPAIKINITAGICPSNPIQDNRARCTKVKIPISTLLE